jgi:hypothetical protein
VKPEITQPAAEKRKKTDWEAAERDYRTGRYTDQEIADKYNISRPAVTKQAKVNGWKKDLSDAIRRATNAELVAVAAAEKVAERVASGSKEVVNTVLVVAELNKQVILKHRQDIEAIRKVAKDLLNEVGNAALMAGEQELLAQILAGSGAEPKDEAEARRTVRKALDFGNRVSSVKLLADTFTKLQDGEIKAFRLDTEKPMTEDPIAAFLATLSARGSRLPIGGAE